MAAGKNLYGSNPECLIIHDFFLYTFHNFDKTKGYN